MDMGNAVFIVLFGVLLCHADAGRVKRGNWDIGLDPQISSGKPSLTGSLGYKNGGLSANGHYTETFGGRDHWGGSLGYDKGGFSTGLDYKGTKGYDRFGGHIGYQKDNFHVKGTGFRDSTGNWGAGVSLGWRFKRSLRAPKGAFYLRMEADPCQYILYDRNADAKITNEELREVFPDRHLADDLFTELDINDDGKITEEEFDVAKTYVIIGCAVPGDKA